MKAHEKQTQITTEHEKLLAVITTFEHNDVAIDMLRHFFCMLAYMKHGERLTAKKISGKKYWESQDVQIRKDVGRHISRLVSMELLPLKIEGTDGANSCLYTLK
jgi:hypothetical protein